MTRRIRQAIAIRVKDTFIGLNLAVLLLAAIVVAAAGPFGTYASHGFGARLLYWSLVVAVSAALGSAIVGGTRAAWPAARPLRLDLLRVVIMSLAFTPLLWLLTAVVLQSPRASDPAFAIRLAGYVAVVTLAILTTRRLLPGFEPVPYPGTRPPPRLARRLPDDADRDILRLAVRDHFVEIVTRTEHHRVRMRLADAIDEMDTVPGHCTHRSHWVTEEAVVGVERTNGRISLKLINGDTVPVSRTYKPGLEEAGLL